ncbi:MAG: hypothetical protein ACOCXP_02220 [Candidatus Dojkabacteria bacterium]
MVSVESRGTVNIDVLPNDPKQSTIQISAESVGHIPGDGGFCERTEGGARILVTCDGVSSTQTTAEEATTVAKELAFGLEELDRIENPEHRFNKFQRIVGDNNIYSAALKLPKEKLTTISLSHIHPDGEVYVATMGDSCVLVVGENGLEFNSAPDSDSPSDPRISKYLGHDGDGRLHCANPNFYRFNLNEVAGRYAIVLNTTDGFYQYLQGATYEELFNNIATMLTHRMQEFRDAEFYPQQFIEGIADFLNDLRKDGRTGEQLSAADDIFSYLFIIFREN